MHFLLLIYVQARLPIIYIRKQKSASVVLEEKGLKMVENEYLDCMDEQCIRQRVIWSNWREV